MSDNDVLKLIERIVQDSACNVGSNLSASEATPLTDEIASLKPGTEARNEIGQAQGIILERFHLDADAAFATLVRLSQHANQSSSTSPENWRRPA
jgi:hypothetical protein